MRALIVHAHHELQSFNAAMTREAVHALVAARHEVDVSDLYAMGFDPVSDRRNFTTVRDPAYLRQQDEEAYASEHEGFAPDVQTEMDKLFWCDVLILQFPLWWFGMPAILKGWIDRVFAEGRAFGNGRMYDRGVFRGKRAMCALTTGGRAPMFAGGPHDAIERHLFPIQHGVLGFTGFTVFEPSVTHAPHRMTSGERALALRAHTRRVLDLTSSRPGANEDRRREDRETGAIGRFQGTAS
jgi:NAD(P)H dehydrogenase (quinone)